MNAGRTPPRLLHVFRDADISPEPLAGAAVAVIGFGAQGRAQALNLRDGGFKVTVGLRRNSPRREQAAADGFRLAEPPAAVRGADVVALLLPDEEQGPFFNQTVRPKVRPGALLVFAHGAAVTSGDAVPPEEVDVALVAPMGPGAELRRRYERGEGLNAQVAVARDATGRAWFRALAYARALGCGRAGVFATTFAEETCLDLFSEQAVLCGGVPALAEAAFETLVAAGYPPALAYVECIRELKYIADLIYEYGLDGMRRRVSTAALYGGATRGPRVIGADAKAALRTILAAVEDGSFSRELKSRGAGREQLLRDARNERLEQARTEFERLTGPPDDAGTP